MAAELESAVLALRRDDDTLKAKDIHDILRPQSRWKNVSLKMVQTAFTSAGKHLPKASKEDQAKKRKEREREREAGRDRKDRTPFKRKVEQARRYVELGVRDVLQVT